MAPLSRLAILSLSALTIHFSVLSIVLHISRSTKAARYHASAAVVLTELGKILISIFLVFWSRELRGRVWDRKRARQQAEEEEEENEGPAWLGNGGGDKKDSGRISRDSLEESNSGSEYAGSGNNSPNLGGRSSDSGAHQRNMSIRVNVTLAQSNPNVVAHSSHHQPATPDMSTLPAFPSVSVIPPTPGLPPSPARTPDASALHPLRSYFERPSMTHLASMLDMLDRDAWHVLREVVFGPGWWLLAIPSVLFVFQANAQYVASGNLSVPLFQLAYQLKIPATAFWAVILLRKPVTIQQWISLFILSAGVGIVQLHSTTPSSPLSSSTAASHASHPPSSKLIARAVSLNDTPLPSQSLGLIAVCLACLSSGFASTYFERMLKAPSPPQSNGVIVGVPPPQPSLWVRNIQLSLFGLAAGLPVALWEVMRDWSSFNFEDSMFGSATWFVFAFWEEFFQGFNGMTWVVIFLQVTGGLLAALVMQHADNVAKCFSTSISILISFVCSIFLFDYQISLGVAIGAAMVLFSTYSYTVPGALGRWVAPASTGSAKRRPMPTVVIHGDKS